MGGSPENTAGTHDVHEKTGTYWKFEGLAGNFISLILNDLFFCCGSGAGKKGN